MMNISRASLIGIEKNDRMLHVNILDLVIKILSTPKVLITFGVCLDFFSEFIILLPFLSGWRTYQQFIGNFVVGYLFCFAIK